jgi:hypothetical protein
MAIAEALRSPVTSANCVPMAEGVHPRGTCARAVQLRKNSTAQLVNRRRVFAALLQSPFMQPPVSDIRI